MQTKLYEEAVEAIWEAAEDTNCDWDAIKNVLEWYLPKLSAQEGDWLVDEADDAVESCENG